MRDFAFYNQVARLHIMGINQGFLTTLGLPFLALLYEAIDRCPTSVLLVEQKGTCVTGFVSGATSMKPIYKQMLYHFPRLILTLLPSIFKPSRIRRIFEILSYSRMSVTKRELDLPSFELLSIVVAEDARGTGSAERLFNGLNHYCFEHGIDSFKIVVGDALLPAHRFYQRMGAVPVCRMEVHKGEGSVVYVHKISRRV